MGVMGVIVIQVNDSGKLPSDDLFEDVTITLLGEINTSYEQSPDIIESINTKVHTA